MKMNISEFARLSGVSVRTLHYYDEIGLLKPDFVDENTSYRFYGEKAFSTMQEILFYRELDFSLKNIKEFITSPSHNKTEVLKAQKQLLILKKQRLERIIEAISSDEKGEKIMSFDAFNKSEIDKYTGEVKRRFGGTEAYRQSQEKTANYTENDWSNLEQGLNQIISEFDKAKNNGVKATDQEAKVLVKKLQNFITETQYSCTNEILASLGEMYVADERFKKNIDKAGSGTAEFMSKAIKEYCKKSITVVTR